MRVWLIASGLYDELFYFSKSIWLADMMTQLFQSVRFSQKIILSTTFRGENVRQITMTEVGKKEQKIALLQLRSRPSLVGIILHFLFQMFFIVVTLLERGSL